MSDRIISANVGFLFASLDNGRDRLDFRFGLLLERHFDNQRCDIVAHQEWTQAIQLITAVKVELAQTSVGQVVEGRGNVGLGQSYPAPRESRPRAS